jgi:hypothetical protein
VAADGETITVPDKNKHYNMQTTGIVHRVCNKTLIERKRSMADFSKCPRSVHNIYTLGVVSDIK